MDQRYARNPIFTRYFVKVSTNLGIRVFPLGPSLPGSILQEVGEKLSTA